MRLVWTAAARGDLVRLHDFLEPANARAADRAVDMLYEAAQRLPPFPRMGSRLEAFDPREVRRLIVGDYELRYEIQGEVLFVLRIWHGREDR